MILKVFCDGGARGNPGPAASAAVFFLQDRKIGKVYKYLGIATNNQAEYEAVILAFDWILKNKGTLKKILEVEFFLDSKLVVKQLNSEYKIKNTILKRKYLEIRFLISSLGLPVRFFHIPRDENFLADSILNSVLDKKL